MTIRPKLILELLAVFVLVASCLSFAQNQAAVTPDAAMTVTTTGGTSGTLPLFTGASTIANSIVFQNSTTGIGIGAHPSSTAMLDVNGKAIVRGIFNLSRTGDATTSAGFDSYPFIFNTSGWSTAAGGDLSPIFGLQAEVVGNNTASPSATFNLLYNHNGGTPSETGLFINSNGTIHFAPGQTFPAGGPFCIATAGGFGSGGTTFVGPGFNVPAENNCTPWSGFTKTASTVILTTSGAACLSGTGKTLTVSVSSADPDFLGAGTQASDYIRLTRTGTTGSFSGGTDQGQFAGSAEQVTCTSSVLSLPDIHD
jgi:hypothetical protein